MAVYEGLWDCRHCETQGVPGGQRACPSCGSVREDDVEFYLPEDGGREITDDAELADAEAGRDWYCTYCEAGNTAVMAECHQCGAPKEDAAEHVTKEERAAKQAAAERERAAEDGGDDGGGGGATTLVGVGLGAAALLLVCCVASFFLFGSSDVRAEVTGFSWERSVAVEEYKTVREEGWDVPRGGRVLDREERVHHHEEVLDGYETKTRKKKVQVGTRRVKAGKKNLGNGRFKDIYREEPVYETRTETYREAVYRDEPVYETWFTYEIDKWVTVRTARSQGRDQAPEWPDPELRDGQRAGAKTGRYVIHVKDGETGKAYAHELPEAEWGRYRVGQAVIAEVSGDEVESLRLPEKGA